MSGIHFAYKWKWKRVREKQYVNEVLFFTLEGKSFLRAVYGVKQCTENAQTFTISRHNSRLLQYLCLFLELNLHCFSLRRRPRTVRPPPHLPLHPHDLRHDSILAVLRGQGNNYINSSFLLFIQYPQISEQRLHVITVTY